jgi:transcriptional regulator with XRE-family HTH domain/fructose-1,6-bisphosphatase/inositol monophosphatase family enzyme
MTMLERMRKTKKLTQQALADRAGVARQTISSIEAGDGNPTQEVLEKLAGALECSISDLSRPARRIAPEWSLEERRLYTECLERVVELVGKEVLNYTGPNADQFAGGHGHVSAAIDAYAHDQMMTAVSSIFESRLNNRQWIINLVFEDAVATLSAFGFTPTDEQRQNAPVAYIDEIDGTTNVKRAVAARLGGERPKSAVCIALKNHENSAVIECGAIYAFDEGVTFSGFLAGGDHYIALRNDGIIGVNECKDAAGDSKQRIIVANYSNGDHLSCAHLKVAIEEDVFAGKCETYGGCRSSTMDVIDIIRNQYDAYVDCRQLWTRDLDHNSVLRVYDVAGVLPVAKGAGLKVVMPDGADFTLRGLRGDAPMSVIIGRPAVVEQVVSAIAPVLSQVRMI